MPVPSHDGPHQTSISSHQQRLTASNLASNNNLHNHSSTAPTSNHSLSRSSSRSPSPPSKSSAMPKRRNTLNSKEAAYEEALERGDIVAMEKLAAANEDDDDSGVGKRKRKRSGGGVNGTEESRYAKTLLAPRSVGWPGSLIRCGFGFSLWSPFPLLSSHLVRQKENARHPRPWTLLLRQKNPL